MRRALPPQQKHLRLQDSDDELIFPENEEEHRPRKAPRGEPKGASTSRINLPIMRGGATPGGPQLPELSEDSDSDNHSPMLSDTDTATKLHRPLLDTTTNAESRIIAHHQNEDDDVSAAPSSTKQHPASSSSSDKPGADRTPYWVLAKLFEKILRTSGKQKKQLLSRFFANYDMRDSFPLIRLLVPQLDKERQAYGMKEKNIAKVLVETLGISKTADDAQRLIHWKKPVVPQDSRRSSDKAPLKEIAAGDFGTAVEISVSKRNSKERGDISLAQVNQALDDLNASLDKKDKAHILSKLLRKTTANELKWIVRTIIKDMKLGVSEKSILKLLHPEALDMFNVCSNLRTVCEQLKWSPHALQTAATPKGKYSVSLSAPLKPMLASRRSMAEVSKLVTSIRYQIETKYDGERLHVHKNGKTLRLFSRNANDVTDLYENKLRPVIFECVKAETCILDGELLVWDTVANSFEDFGGLKRYATSARELETSRTTAARRAEIQAYMKEKQLCYILFDLLFVNGESIVTLPLNVRLELLHRAVPKTRARLLEIAPHKECKTSEELLDAMDQAIMNRDEGIILKTVDGTYVPNERKQQWIKLKPEYMDGAADDLDLLIVGGYYGGGLGGRAGTISHFLLGVPAPGQAEPLIYWSFSKVGTGYSYGELRDLQLFLQPHWKRYDTASPPGCLQLAEPHKRSRILQIKAAQFVATDKFKAGYTLRFPRVVRIRADKEWNEGLTFAELLDMAREREGRVVSFRALATSGGGGTRLTKGGRKKSAKATPVGVVTAASLRRPHGVIRSALMTDVSNVLVTDNIFAGLEFCVATGSEQHTKADMERLIHRCSGRLVQHPTQNTFCVIAAIENLKARNLRDAATVDIVRPQWLLDCAAQKQLLPFQPKYVIFTRPSTRTAMLKDCDRYGDSYTMSATAESLSEVFAEVGRQEKNLSLLSEIDLLSVDEHYLYRAQDGTGEQIPWWQKLRDCVVYFDRFSTPSDPNTLIVPNVLDSLLPIVTFYGGAVTDTLDHGTTHIIVAKEDLMRWRALRREQRKLLGEHHHAIHLVEKSWVEEQLTTHEVLPARDYYLDQFALQLGTSQATQESQATPTPI